MILDKVQPTSDQGAMFIKCDLTSRADIASAVKTIRSMGLSPSILINNAGIWSKGLRIHELSDGQLQEIFQINVLAAFRLIHEFLPDMRRAGFGRIINMASVLALAGVARMSII